MFGPGLKLPLKALSSAFARFFFPNIMKVIYLIFEAKSFSSSHPSFDRRPSPFSDTPPPLCWPYYFDRLPRPLATVFSPLCHFGPRPHKTATLSPFRWKSLGIPHPEAESSPGIPLDSFGVSVRFLPRLFLIRPSFF